MCTKVKFFPFAFCVKVRLHDAVSYEDLESNDIDPAVHLKLSRIDRYLNGPTPNLPAMSMIKRFCSKKKYII